MKFSDLHPNVRIRIITDFCTDFAHKSIMPFMAIYLTLRLGMEYAGLLMVIHVLCSMVSGLAAGYLSDLMGRKRLMVIAQTLQTCALFWLAAANSPWYDSVTLTCVMFLLSGISSGITAPVAHAMIVDVSTEKERQLVYGLQYWTINAAAAAGAVAGGLLFESYRFVLFAVVFAESLFTLFILVFLIRETHVPSPIQESGKTAPAAAFSAKDFVKTYIIVLKDRRFMLFLAATVLAFALEYQLDKFIAVRLRNEFHTTFLGRDLGGIQMLSLIITLNTVIVVLFALPLSRWLKRWNPLKLLTAGMVLYTAGFGLLGCSNYAMILIFAAVIMTVGELMYAPVRQTLLAGMVPDNSRATYLAVDGLSYHAASLLGSLGMIAGSWLSSPAMSGLFMIMGAVAILFFRKSGLYSNPASNHEVKVEY
ncbi:MFS transporter [Paenibacillus sp. PK3_47]|uniref:MDR family MFS transporter n=1 Tax=Paenibacillus sp. PK3_47 TaxID=2072642 RepID=UPI00201DE56E|nr:MFS transporter [Paenibacillus sp. PK3_47]UQZ32727.1 MFS transporter [Paenibacillus sp. PK3_47]